MTLTIEIQMDNEAFDGAWKAQAEVGRILQEIAEKIEGGNWQFPIMDINGNAVGKMKVTR